MDPAQNHNARPRSLQGLDTNDFMAETADLIDPNMDYANTLGLEDLTVKMSKHSRRNARRQAKRFGADNSQLGKMDGQTPGTVPFLGQAQQTRPSPLNDLSRAAGELIWSLEVGKEEPAACVASGMASGSVHIAHGAECAFGTNTLKAQSPFAATQGRNRSDYKPLPITDTRNAPSSFAPSPPGCFLVRGHSQRYSYNPIPTHSGLPIPSLGQAIRPLAVSPLKTAISYDADRSSRLSKKQLLEKGGGHAQSIPKRTFHGSPASESPRNGHVTGQEFRKAKPLSAPIPTAQYLSVASAPPRLAPSPQHLLLVLDLNGTLVYRHKRGSAKYSPRPSLQLFLDYCFANHSVLIWSSATPMNVTGMCSQIFSDSQRLQLLGEWGRDTLDLTNDQYHAKTQVYKRLDRVWHGFTLRHSHPNAGAGEHWSQANTLLLDDSVTKAQAQPFNLVEVPEFTSQRRQSQQEKDQEVLSQVVAYLEQARAYENVSAFVRENKFMIQAYPTLDWQRHL